MGPTAMTRRVLAWTFLLVALAVSGLSWTQAPAAVRDRHDTALTLTGPPGLAVDAALNGRSDALSAVRTAKLPDRSGAPPTPAVLAGIGLFLGAGFVTLARSSPVPLPLLWRRSSVALRAPPRLRLS